MIIIQIFKNENERCGKCGMLLEVGDWVGLKNQIQLICMHCDANIRNYVKEQENKIIVK